MESYDFNTMVENVKRLQKTLEAKSVNVPMFEPETIAALFIIMKDCACTTLDATIPSPEGERDRRAEVEIWRDRSRRISVFGFLKFKDEGGNRKMKFDGINKTYTNKIAEYLREGYVFNTMTMCEKPGREIAWVALTDGSEVLIVALRDFCDAENCTTLHSGVEIRVSRCIGENIRANSERGFESTVFNRELETVSTEKFYEIASYDLIRKYYGTKEEAVEAGKRRIERYKNHAENETEKEITITPKIAEMLKQRICRIEGISRVNASKIKAWHGRNVYYFSYCGKKYPLH